MTNRTPARGEIWLVDWSPGRGSEQSGRPALIVQIDDANRNPRYPNTIVAAISTRGREVTAHVHLRPSTGNRLTAPSFVKCEQILTISKERLERRIGVLDAPDLARVSAALRTVLDA